MTSLYYCFIITLWSHEVPFNYTVVTFSRIFTPSWPSMLVLMVVTARVVFILSSSFLSQVWDWTDAYRDLWVTMDTQSHMVTHRVSHQIYPACVVQTQGIRMPWICITHPHNWWVSLYAKNNTDPSVDMKEAKWWHLFISKRLPYLAHQNS